MSFKIVKQPKESKARWGELSVKNGVIKTPFFMPIATQGSVKGLAAAEMNGLGAQILLSNTYHLWLRPGEDVLNSAGGLHKFMKWDRPILTDSGGYQVFSLSKMRKLRPDGVEFQSHLNGEKYFLSPEKAIEIQQAIGSDIMMVLDECVAYPCDKKAAEAAVKRTTEWAKKSSKFKLKTKSSQPEADQPTADKQLSAPNQKLFGIVQGSLYRDLRLRSAKELVALDFDGYAIGGLAVGEPVEEMYKVLDYLIPELPEDKPRYLMGVGYPEQIIEAVKRGVDMFDCVLPTRNARHGSLFIQKRKKFDVTKTDFYETVSIKNEKYKDDMTILDENCDCPTCQAGYSKAYLRHLLVAKEALYIRLATQHNLRFYLRMMAEVRSAIKKGAL